jgi:O-antigen biosynthesis protein
VKEILNLPTDGETALVTPIGDDLALISGVAAVMPGTIDVLLNGDPSMSMKADVISWARKDAPPEAAIGFVAIVPIRLARTVRLRSVMMRRNGQPVRYALVRQPATLPVLMQIIAADALENVAEVTGGIVQALAASTGTANRKRSAAALSVLTMAAPNDGWIEVIGALDTGEIFLQGWAVSLPADQIQVVIAHDGLLSGTLTIAKVQRSDLGDKGHGFIGLLDTGEPIVNPENLKQLFFRTGKRWLALHIYDRCVLLPSIDVPAHIRDGLVRAEANIDTLRIMRRAGERFDGRDTVSGLNQPVRIGMDMVVAVPGGGLLVAGWMLDPECLVGSVVLRSGLECAKIDDIWTRLPRSDVSAAFQHNEVFAGHLDPLRNDHGFLAYVPNLTAAGEAPLFFEISLGETVAFYPLKVVRTLSRRALEKLISPLDSRTAAAGAAIERHIGPMMQAFMSPSPHVTEIRDFGFDDANVDRVLIIGAGFDPDEVVVTLSLLALDPETRGLPIIVSAPIEAFGTIAPEVERISGFYDITVRVIGGDGVQDACDAFEVAAGATRADTLIFLAAGVLPRSAGWLSNMERVYRKRGNKALVSPTIVYEDDSVRFAGTWLDNIEQKLVDRYIGYPCDVVRGSQPTEVIAGSTACCIVPRSAIEVTGGFTRSYLNTTEKVRDLCLKLRLEGTPSVWLPSVEMISADDDSVASSLQLRRLTQRIDRWSFDRKWSLLINNMR